MPPRGVATEWGWPATRGSAAGRALLVRQPFAAEELDEVILGCGEWGTAAPRMTGLPGRCAPSPRHSPRRGNRARI